MLHLQSGVWATINGLNFAAMGYVVVALFVAAWIASVILWKVCRPQRIAEGEAQPLEHLHADGLRHRHTHFR